jgi:hypothetical protein
MTGFHHGTRMAGCVSRNAYFPLNGTELREGTACGDVIHPKIFA